MHVTVDSFATGTLALVLLALWPGQGPLATPVAKSPKTFSSFSAPAAAAGGEDFAETLGRCIEPVYSRNDNLGFENRCQVKAHVFYVLDSSTHGGISVEVGETEYTSLQRSRVSSSNGVSIYACPMDYNPVGADDEFIPWQRNLRFRSRRR